MATRPASNLDVNIRGRDQLTPELSKIESRIIRFVGAISSALAAVRIVGFPVTTVREFEREMANVQKTTGFTAQEISKLGKELRTMSGRLDISATDLAKIAAAAGQQGLGREGVEGVAAFTDSVSRMSSVLDISVDEAGAAVGKLASIFKVPLTEIEKMVSSLNEVANNSTATGDQLLDVTRRIGDAAGAFDDYYKTIGIGAAAIDFGASAEVVGTSITKVFADMQSKGEKFAHFMNMSTKEWINIVQTDGIQAFKMYLDRLRDLEGESRQRTIRELSGTGRIGAMLNKFVNDTTNTILDRNLASALRGRETGTSALREQETVLKTLDAQANILLNTFTNLGITAGERFAKPVTAFLAQLSAELQNPAVLAFAESIGDMFLSLFTTISDGLKFVASLNVNWENFVSLAKILITIKLVQFFGAWMARLTGLNGLLKVVTKSASDMNKELDGKPGEKAGPTGLLATMRQIRESHRDELAVIAQKKKATEDLEKAEAKRNAAQKAFNATQGVKAAAGASPGLQTAADNLGAARRNTSAVAARGRAAEEAAQRAWNTRVEQRERQHTERLAVIERDYQSRRTVLKAEGRTAELRQLTMARNAQLQAEQQTYDRSMTQINAYHVRRLAAVRAQAQAEAVAASAGVRAAEREVQKANAAAGTAQAGTAAALAGIALRKANKEVDQAKQALDGVGGAAGKAASLITGLRTAFTGLRSAIGWIFSVASRATWFTFLAYQIADMFGLIDKIAPFFKKAAEAVGLYSESSRKAAQEQANLRKKMAEEQGELDNLIDKYHELRDASTGRLRDVDVNALPAMLQDENRELNRQAITELLTIVKGGAAELNKLDITKATLIEDQTKTKARLDEMEKSYQAALERMNTARANITQGQIDQIDGTGPVGLITKDMRRFVAARKEVEEIGTAIKGLRTNMDETAEVMSKSIEDVARAAKEDLATIGPVLAGMFTDETADVFMRYAGDLSSMRDELRKLQEQSREAIQEEIRLSEEGGEALDAQKVKTAQLTNQIVELQAKIQKATEDANKEIKALETSKGVSTELLNSAGLLRTLLTLSPEDLAGLREALGLLTQTGAKLTGLNAPPPARPTTGDDDYNPKTNGESAARRAAKARLAVLKAEAEAEGKLLREANKERLDQLEYTNSRSLISIKDFYAQKEKIQQSDLDNSIRIAKIELDGVLKEMTEAKDEATKLQAKASSIRLEGDIKALTAQKEYLAQQIRRDQEQATRAFTDNLARSTLDLAQFFGADDATLFKQALENYNVEYRDFINRLKSESEDMPELLPIINLVEMRNQFTTAALVVGEIGRSLDADSRAVDTFATRLEMLRDKGTITTGDLAKGMDLVRANQVALHKASLERMEAQLRDLPKETIAYKELALEIEDVRLNMEKLANESNAVAKEINDNFTGELSSMFQNFKLTDDIGETLMNTLLGFLQVLQNTLGQALAEGIMGAINNGIGGDGIGGLLASAFGMATDVGKPDGTPMNPLHVIMPTQGLIDGIGGGMTGIANGLGGLLGGGDSDPLGDFISNLDGVMAPIPDEIQGGMFSFLAPFDGSISSFMSGAESVFSSLLSGLGGVFSGLMNGLGNILGFGGGAAVGMMHSGGRVGSGGGLTKRVHPGVFANAPRYHNGTTGAGLKPNEVPTILEKGETVRTQAQERAIQQALSGANAGGGGSMNLRQVLVLDPDLVPQAMQSAPGEKAMMTFVRNNASTIRQIIK